MAILRRLALFSTCILAICACVADGGRHEKTPSEPPSPPSDPPAPSPAPGADCMSVIYDLLPCLDYLTVGSKDKKPPKTCCSGLEVVLQTDPNCLCEGLKESGSMGIQLNMTRALALPSACGSSTPPPNCDIPLPPDTPPTPTPANPPEVPPESSPTPEIAPSDNAGGPTGDQSPAPAPSDAATFTILSSNLCVALAVSLLVTLFH